MTAFEEAGPATNALRDRLAQAHLYLCTDAREARGDFDAFVAACFAGGVDIIQLRDKSLEAARELELLEVLARRAREAGALFSVNDRADLAVLAGADVLHVGQGDLPALETRRLIGPDRILGLSVGSAICSGRPARVSRHHAPWRAITLSGSVAQLGSGLLPLMPRAASTPFVTTNHINVQATPDMDAQAIARAVAAEIDRRQREQRTRRLSSLHDMD